MAITLVVDIGSSSVGAAFVSRSQNATPKILFSTRLPIISQNDQESGSGRTLTAITSALESVMNTISAEHIVAHKTHIIFSSPWYISKTKFIKKEYDSSTLVTHHLIKQLTKETETKLAEDFKPEEEVIEHRIIQTKLNGYATPDPYGKKTKNLEIVFFASAVMKDVLESVRRVVGKHFHVKDDEMSSFALAAFSVISGILPTEKDFLIVDVRGEVTDLSLVADGALSKNLFFPQGKNALIKAASEGSGQSAIAALSLLNTISHGHSEPSAQAKIIKFTETFTQKWSQAYTKTLQDTVLPSSVFLVADRDVEMFFENILNGLRNENNLHLLKYLNMRSFVDTASVSTDQSLALESIFVTMV